MTYAAVVTCEVALTKSPLSLPSGGDWVALSQVVTEYSMDRGKQDQLATHQPARVTIVLDNGDTDLDQSLPASKGNTAWSGATAYTTADGVTYNGRHYNCISNHTNHVPPNATYWEQASQIGGDNALPYTPIRLKVNGTVLWTGYTEAGWEPTGSMFGAGTVTVNATDWLGWAATKTMPDSLWAAWVTRERPRLWIRGQMNISQPTSTLDSVYNMAQRWTGAYGDLSLNSPTYDGHVFRVGGIAEGASGYAIRQTFNTTWASVHASPLETISPTTEWSVAFWMKADTPGAQRYGTDSGGDDWWFSTGASGEMQATVKLGGVQTTATVTGDHCDGTPHIVLCQVVSQGGLRGVYLATDLGNNSNGFAGTGATGGGQIELNGTDGSIVGEFCYWDSGSGGHKASALIPGWFEEPEPGYGASLSSQANAWSNQTTFLEYGTTRSERLDALSAFAVAELPTANITVDDPSEILWTYGVDSQLADAINTLGTSWLGDTFMERGGELRIYDAAYASSDADDYDTVHAQITDDPAASAPPVVLRASGGGRSGTRVERVVNEVSVNYATPGALEAPGVFAFDLASQERYGVRPKTFASQAGHLDPTLATTYLAVHKDPPIEIPDVVLQPWGDQDLTDFVCDTVELERRVTYRKALGFPSSAEVINQDCRIIGEKWTWRNGAGNSAGDWTVTLRLAPV